MDVSIGVGIVRNIVRDGGVDFSDDVYYLFIQL